MTKSPGAALEARCDELFDHYPQAIEWVDDPDDHRRGGACAITVMLAAGKSRSYIRIFDRGTSYTACERGEAGPRPVEDASQAVCEAITSGVPLLAGHSLFGWKQRGVITTLITSDTSPELADPTWGLFPNADLPKKSWPPFAGEYLFGSWFWDHVRAGNVVDLAPVIARTRDVCFAVPVSQDLGRFCFAASADVPSAGDIVLPRGRYVFLEVLREGTALPSLGDLLADPARVDLGPRLPSA